MKFNTDILSLFDKGWALVTAGDLDCFNTMTISWGAMGTLWNKPTCTVYVKPVRYTHEFMDANVILPSRSLTRSTATRLRFLAQSRAGTPTRWRKAA